MKVTVLLLVLLTLSGTALSWSWYVHVVIYMIAREAIEHGTFVIPPTTCPTLNGEPEEGKYVNTFFNTLVNYKELSRMALKDMPKTSGKRAIYEDRNEHLIAAWPDDVITPGFPLEAHYLDQFHDGSTSTVAGLGAANTNVFEATGRAYDYLMTVDRKDIHKEDENLRISYMLANFIHLIGDMHQPMHMISYKPPGGLGSNRGGHGVKLIVNAEEHDLHKYWDNAMNIITDVGEGLNDKTAEIYLKKAKELMERNKLTVELKDKKLGKFNDFAAEMFKIGIEHAYQHYDKVNKLIEFKLKSPLVDGMKRECERLITNAGYTLASYLLDIYFAINCQKR